MKKNHPFLNWLGTAVLMMALWFVMSGKTEPKFLIIGAASSMLVAFICLRLVSISGAKTDSEYYLLGVNIFRFIAYFAWLLVQIAASAINIAKVSVLKLSDVDPSIVWFRADYDNPAARAMLANSITLTPGTITIDITDVRDGVLDGSMQAKVAWLYGETIDFAPIDPNDVRPDERKERPVPVRLRYRNRRTDS